MNQASVLDAGRNETNGTFGPPVNDDRWVVFLSPWANAPRFEKLLCKVLPTDSGLIPSSVIAAYSLLALLQGDEIISFSSKLIE